MNAIAISNLRLDYGTTTALDDVSLEMEAGSVFGLLGPNGAGKTSIVKVITGLVRPTSGTVQINGMDPGKHSREVKSMIGLVAQESALYGELSAVGNCEFQASLYRIPSRQMKKRIAEVLDLVDPSDRKSEPVRNFSGGMKRRLAIGKALLHDPRILILDEPTLGVDVQGTHKIWDYISRFAELGKTIIVTTNVMNEADRLANDVCIIDSGKVIVRGSPTELKSRLGNLEIVLTFADAQTLSRAKQRLNHSATVRGMNLVIAADNGTEDLLMIVRSLDGPETPSRIELKQPTLDDVFLAHTGRSLRD